MKYLRSFVMNVLVRLCTLLEFLGETAKEISGSEEEKRDLRDGGMCTEATFEGA